MSARTIHKSSAVVLHSLDYGESDRIVTFYTSDFGKLKGIAKGARRSKKRFVNALEPFCCCTVMFSKKVSSALALIEGCDINNHNARIREDLDKTLVSTYLIDLIDKFTIEGKKNNPLFQLLTHFLSLINEGIPSEKFIRFFEIRLLKLSGYEPLLESCRICRKPLAKMISHHFIPAEGGLRCAACCENSFNSLCVSAGTINTLILGKEIALERMNSLSLSDQSLRESREILERFISHLLGKELKSLQVLNQIRKMDT